jgi:ribosomal protein S18
MTESEKYTIGYIDENDEDVILFEQQFSDYFDIKVLRIDSSTTLEDVISWIYSTHLDLIVVDYNLKENLSIDFYGNEILETLNRQRLNFPMYMFTSYEEEAISKSDEFIDDLIFDKQLVSKNYEIMVTRIKNKIKKYKSELKQKEKRHRELSLKSELTITEEDELLRLDYFLEETANKYGTTPISLKETRSLKKLCELVEKADKIINKVENNE